MSKVYTRSGDILPLDLKTLNGKPFFRKMFSVEVRNVEKEIAKILKANPLPNVVEIYEVTDLYYDMELLDINVQLTDTVIEECKKAKDQLQGLGIMYIDWKIDNIGSTIENKIKVYDFDCSGIVNRYNSLLWYMSPCHAFSYRMAMNNGCNTPLEIDNYSFQLEFENFF
jgi:hypothetical protein